MGHHMLTFSLESSKDDLIITYVTQLKITQNEFLFFE